MDSLKELFKIGNGPSSSHTMGPERAAKQFKKRNPDAERFEVELYGSLALTGRGHLTDWIIKKTMVPKATDVIWKPEYIPAYHPNGMLFKAFDKSGKEIDKWLVFSVGGGTIMEENEDRKGSKTVYPLNKMADIKAWCNENQKELWEYVVEYEGEGIFDYLITIWEAMEAAVKRGIEATGVLPGTLKYPRKAARFYRKSRTNHTKGGYIGRIFAYTLAVAEENGSGGKVVTAPTCGSCGVIPGLLHAMREEYDISTKDALKSLAIAGIIGNLIKENATISGAEGGCQAEVGSACAMAAAMACFLLGGSLDQIEYAAEMALEHHLGLTCDPVGGYVQVPCIERNAAAAARALESAVYSLYTDGKNRVSFDEVVETMGATGRDLKKEYRETSLGGLAKFTFNAKC